MHQTSWLRLQASTPSLLSYENRRLYSTWDVSYAQVERQNANSARLLRLWAYFGHEDLWFELLQKGRPGGPTWFQDLTSDVIEFNKAVRLLCDYGLVEADTSSKERGTESRGYGMHSCVHTWTTHVLNETRDDDMAQLAMVCVASYAPNSRQPRYWVVQRRMLQHVSRCLAAMALVKMPSDGETAWIANSFGHFLADQGRLAEAEPFFQRAVQHWEIALGPDHTSTLSALQALGTISSNQGRDAEARLVFERVVQGFETVFGPGNPAALGAVNGLGVVYHQMGQPAKAEAMWKRLLEESERAPSHHRLEAINNLGVMYLTQGQDAKAEAMFQRLLQGKDTEFNPDHITTFEVMNNLAIAYFRQGQIYRAEVMFGQVLRGRLTSLGPNHLSTLKAIYKLGCFYHDHGGDAKAKVMFEYVLQGREAVLGPDHPLTLEVAAMLDCLNEDQGRVAGA